MSNDARPTRRRQPWLAAILSLLLPGLGHLYAGRPGTAIRMAGLALGVWLLVITLMLWFPFGALTLLVAGALALAAVLGITVDAARTARAAPVDFVLRPYNHWLVYSALIVAGYFLAKTPGAFVQAYRIPSAAMEPTLLVDDFIFVAKLGAHRPDPELGTLVVFASKEEPGLKIIKRIVGVAGDTVSMRDNVLLRNGSAVVEPYVTASAPNEDYEDPGMRWQTAYYLGTDTVGYRPTLRTWGPLRVPPDSVFVLGDNRANSFDSRFYGFVGTDRIEARPLVVYYSYDPEGLLPLPSVTAVRRDRIGKRVR